jgi:hypothetical protein
MQLLLGRQPPEVFGDRVRIAGGYRLRSPAADAARLLCVGKAAEFELDLVDAIDKLAYDFAKS